MLRWWIVWLIDKTYYRMDYFYFKKLDVYNYSKVLVISIYKLLENYPQEEKFAICSQIRRAAVSVPSNIAEGFGRTSPKEKIHFLEISYGSLMEVSCQIEISHDLGYIDKVDLDSINLQIETIARLLSSLRFSIMKNGDSNLNRMK